MKKATKETLKPKRLILLDAHAILHRAYHALPDFATSKGEPTGALYGLSAMLIKIIEDLKPDYLVACYDMAAPTYRHEAYKLYKAGRKKTDDDLIAQMKSSRKIFEAMNIPIYEKEGFEADDVLGAIVEQVTDLDTLIASGDMDILQLVSGERVKVYTFKKGIKDTVIYDEDGVKARFGFGPELIPDYKGLRGDLSDNIPGIKGIGEKTATILISNFGTIEEIYKALNEGGAADAAFSKAGLTPRIIQLLRDNEEEAQFSKMLATIRRDVPITFVLPAKTFKETLDVKAVNNFWHGLEFRTLGPRLEKAVNGEGEKRKAQGESEAQFLYAQKEGDATPSATPGATSADDLAKTAIALWLVNSNTTQPKLEDILAFANTEDFKVAQTSIMSELKKLGLQKVYDDIEIPLMPVIKIMQERGIKIDRKILTNLSKTYHETAAELEQKIWHYAGREFNISSPKQLGEILFDVLGLTVKNAKKTGAGARSTRESELEKMRDMHPIVPLIFEFRELTKLLSTYIDAIPPLLDADNRLHAKFIQTGTTTGRMASQEPNLQNIPIKTELGRAIRGAFVTEKGFKLCAFDYSQIEIRIAAFLSGDKKLIDIFKNGQDVHTSVASEVFKVAPAQVTADMRRQAKVINFGIMYGMGVTALRQNLGTTRELAQKFLNDYFESFNGLAAYLDHVKVETAARGYTETFFGRRRYFEGIKSKLPFIRAAAERMAINAPIQGTEADIIKIAMSRIYEYCRKAGLVDDVFPLVQVHDELIYEIREDKIDQVVPEIKKIMENVMSLVETKGIPLTANAIVGNNWGELK
ncbi:MAG: DNA polymerase [Candidatus Taylorbacteria bacterium]